MLKVRIIPTLLYRDFGLVKGLRFDSWRHVGSPMQTVKVYNLRGVDELVFLDVTATLTGAGPDLALIDDLADECFMPMSVGGGVASVGDVAGLLRVGADKVVINTAALSRPALLRETAERFGSQCIVMSIDVRRDEGRLTVWSHAGTKPTELDPVAVAEQAATHGAGEILLTSIDRDGTMEGYDVAAIRAVSDAVGIPVIASGGAGTYEHMAAAVLEGGASALAAASMFHFTEATPMEAKHHLRRAGIPVRL